MKHLIDSKDELSLIKLFSKKSIETSLLKNLDKEFSSFQLTQFQQSIITHLYPYFILLLDKKLFKKQLPKPKPLLKLLLKQVQKEKSEDLKKITEQILIAIEKESEIGAGFNMGGYVQPKKKKKKKKMYGGKMKKYAKGGGIRKPRYS